MGLHPAKTSILSLNSVALLDLSRALAANLVLFGHAAEIFGTSVKFHAGLIGVSLFFILSGFLILQSSIQRLSRSEPHFTFFLIDRFARIFTAYGPVLIIVAILNSLTDLGHWGQPGVSTGILAFGGNLLLLQDYPLFQAMSRVIGGTLYIRPYNTAEPFWTIPIEFWIYVGFGLGFFGLIARERIAWPVALSLGIIALPVVVWNAAAGGGNGLSLVWLIGATSAYLWAAAWQRSTQKKSIGMVIVLIGTVCLTGRGIKNSWNFQDTGISICETLILVGSLSILEGAPTLPYIMRRTCTVLASYSYSLYLIHNTILIICKKYVHLASLQTLMLFSMALSHLAAIAIYVAFERHYRRVGRWIKSRAFFKPPCAANSVKSNNF